MLNNKPFSRVLSNKSKIKHNFVQSLKTKYFNFVLKDKHPLHKTYIFLLKACFLKLSISKIIIGCCARMME